MGNVPSVTRHILGGFLKDSWCRRSNTRREFALSAFRRFVGVGVPGRREQRDGIARAPHRYLDQPGRRSAGRAGGAGEAERTGAALARTMGGEIPVGGGTGSLVHGCRRVDEFVAVTARASCSLAALPSAGGGSGR